MTGATTPPLPPSMMFDTQDPKWFERYYEDSERAKRKMQARIDQLEEDMRLARGDRLDGPREVKIGDVRFTATETRILRGMAGSGKAKQDTHGLALYRHASNIRKKLREAGIDAPKVKDSHIQTDPGDGYWVTDELQRYLKKLVKGEPAKKPAPRTQSAHAVKKAPRLSAPKRVLNLEHRSEA